MPCTAVQRGAAEAPGRGHVREFSAIYEAYLVIAVDCLQVLDLGGQGGDITGLAGHVQVALLQLAVDGVLSYEFANEIHCLQSQSPQLPGPFQPDQLLQCLLVHSLPGCHVTAIAAGGAPGNPVCLQQDHAVPQLPQVQGC